MRPWIFVSPASRGIGFHLTRALLQRTNAPIVATARKSIDETKSKILESIKDVDEKRLQVLKLDVLDESSISEAAKHCQSSFPKDQYQLQLALAVPGLLHPEKAPGQIDEENALLSFRTNTIGPMLLMKHFHEFLPRKAKGKAEDGNTDIRNDAEFKEAWKNIDPHLAKFAMMSARVGSISDNKKGGWYSYRSSKAAVNQVVKSFDNWLATQSGDRAMSISLHPGTVKTDLSKEFWASTPKDQLFEPEYAAEKLIDVLLEGGVGVSGRGKCWDYAGKEIQP